MVSGPVRFLTVCGLIAALHACVIALPPRPVKPAQALVQSNQYSLTVGTNQHLDLLPLVRDAATGLVPDDPLVWEVSNPALLKIEPATGRAKGLAPGSVVVWVKRARQDAALAQMIVEIIEGDGALSTITVSPSRHALAVNDAVQLRAQVVLPDGQINGNVLWSSSDDTLARVNPTTGEVSALRPGAVTIVAAYAPSPEIKAVAQLAIYATQAEIPPSPTPVAVSTPRGTRTPPTPRPRPTVRPTPLPVAIRSPDQPAPSTSAPPSSNPGLLMHTFAGNYGTSPRAGDLNRPVDVALDAAGVVYVADSGSQSIHKVVPIEGLQIWAGSPLGQTGFVDAVGTLARFSAPRGVTLGPDGTAYVADTGNHRIRKIAPDGTVSTLAGGVRDGLLDAQGADAQFNMPGALALDAAGNLYVVDTNNHCIRKVTPAGVVTLFAGSGSLGFADGMATAAQFFSPDGIDIDPVGNLYVADSDNHRIRKITPEGAVTTVAGSVPGFVDGSLSEARFTNPADVAVGPDGSIYVADTFNHRIRRIAPYGEVTTYAGSELRGHSDGSALSARLNRPMGLAVSRAGELFIADSSNRAIRMIRVPPLD